MPALIIFLGISFIIYISLPPLAWVYSTRQFILVILGVCAACAVLIGFTLVWFKKIEISWNETGLRLNTMEAFYAIALDIVSQLDQEQVLASIAQRAATYLGSESCYLSQYDQDRNVIRVVAQSNCLPNLIGLEFPRGEGVAGAVIDTGQPLIMNNYQNWDKHLPQLNSYYDAFVGVPLLWKGNIIGTLSIGDHAKRRTFTDFDAWLLHPFADLASIAINNARMFSELKRFSEELARRDAIKTNQLAATEDELIQKADQLRGLVKRMTQLQEAERARIARDMHDSITQIILGAMYATQAAVQGVDSNAQLAKENMRMVQYFLRQIEGEIRETIQNLRPLILDNQGVVQALKQHVEHITDLTGIECTFDLKGLPVQFIEDVEVAIYRIVQEALQNVVAHANAGKVAVRMDFSSDNVLIEVADDGLGFTLSDVYARSKDQFGLIGMRERAESIGASFEIHTRPGEGTKMILVVPISAIRETVE